MPDINSHLEVIGLEKALSAAAAVGGIVMKVAITWWNTRHYHAVRGDRRKLLALHEWTGTWKEISPTSNPARDLTIRYWVGLKEHGGEIQLVAPVDPGSPKMRNYYYRFRGGFEDNNWLVLNYYSIDRSVVEYGTILLCLPADPKTTPTTGMLCGYGSWPGGITYGPVELRIGPPVPLWQRIIARLVGRVWLKRP
ncbi:hypothetical protein ACO9S2_14675 [Nitrospira sp. NS4]|uniref:hypothetical protein n=1 Tax=Nitrospira sp. NS4 TaxID=3414498 RepID=UPI003C2F198D